jgi:hypothetical protein
LLFVLIMGGILGAYFAQEGPGQRLIFTDVVPPVAGGIIGALLIAGAWRLRRVSAQLAGAWTAIGLAVLLYAAGDIIWAFLELIRDAPPFPSLADAFYLLYYPALFLGVVYRVYPRITHRAREPEHSTW